MLRSFKMEDVNEIFKLKGEVELTSEKIQMKADSNLRYDFPANQPARQCRIEIEFTPSLKQDVLVIGIDPFHIMLGDHGQCYISRTLSCNYLVRGEDFEILTDSPNSLHIEYADGKVTVELNGKAMTFKSEYVPTIDRLNIYAISDCVIEKFRCDFDFADINFGIKPSDDLGLKMTFDFYDDIITAPCTMERLDEFMKINSELGFKQIGWIDHGEREQGFWSQSNNLRLIDAYAKESFDSLVDHLKAGCDLAHKYGMEFYSILKPFDMAIMGQTFAPDTPEGKLGKEEVVGGKTAQAINYPAENRHLCMPRRSEKFNFNRPAKIVIKSLQDIPSEAKFEIWVSNNNSEYSQYEKPFHVSIDGKVAIISGLEIFHKYFAVATKERNSESIFNEVQNLISVYDENDDEIDTTLSFQPREFLDLFSIINHLQPAKKIYGDFKKHGFFFDYINIGMPTGVFPAITSKIKCAALDNAYGVIGVAVDVNRNIPGVMSPCENDAKKFWFEMINHALDCDVDGIDIRVTSHINILDYEKYGFNVPIVEEYKKRYGVDINHEDYDPKLLRQIRGEFYTQFLKESGELVHSRGKKFCIHISDMFEGTPDSSIMWNIFWDWQSWLDEAKPDEVTFKAFRPDAFRSHMGKTLISMCQQRGIKVNYCPFVHTMIAAAGIEFIDQLSSSGIIAFDFYENATMYRLQQDGQILCIMPETKKYLQDRKASR